MQVDDQVTIVCKKAKAGTYNRFPGIVTKLTASQAEVLCDMPGGKFRRRFWLKNNREVAGERWLELTPCQTETQTEKGGQVNAGQDHI